MVRKSDSELLAEMRKQRDLDDDAEDAKEEIKKVKIQDVDDVPDMNKLQVQVVEREVTLSLINEKLNFIISKL